MDRKLKSDKKIKDGAEDYKSLYNKPGVIIKEVEISSYFDFLNFEKVKSGSKVKSLGNGAFGEVLLVKNKIDGKLFAMKQMEKSQLLNAGIKTEVVYREINIQMKLVHDHIARLYAYHEDNKFFYLILEYLENGTLFSIIQKSGGMSEEKAFVYFIQVASALNFMHSNNLMHRDLKPENCLIDKEGNVKLGDFGWAVESKKEARATFCGTYEYMAPEIIKESPYGNAVDVWGLGILLYELIHSYSPFSVRKQECDQDSTDYSVEVLKNIIKNKMQIDKDVSEDCKNILLHLLAFHADKRISVMMIFNHPWVRKMERRLERRNTKFKNKSLTINNNNSGCDDLFNSVLDQVQGKEKNKKIKNEYGISFEDIYKTIDDEVKKMNKITLKIEKVEDNYDNNKLPLKNIITSNNNQKNNQHTKLNKTNEIDLDLQDMQMSPIKTLLYDESNFSMFREMIEIDKRIDEKSKKFEILKKRTDKMKQRIMESNNNKEKYIYPHTQQIYDSCNNFENMNTQYQSLINHSEDFKKRSTFDDNYNYQLFNNNTKKGIGKTKAFKKTNNDINIYISPMEEKFENSENNITNPMKLLSEISTQTEQNETVTESTPSLFSRIFGSFKCGGS